MSLDETYEALAMFSRELHHFDDHLRASHAEMRHLHDNIDGLWRDEMRRTYDRAMSDLQRQLDHYAGSRSEQFEQFLERKLAQLRAYLHGG